MILRDLKSFVVIYLVVLSLLFSLSILFKQKLWNLYRKLFPLLLVIILMINVFLFPVINQAHIYPAYEGFLQRLPSNQLIDLFNHSLSSTRLVWIYPLVERYYQGRTLLVTEHLLDSLDLSLERLQSQGRLGEVITIEYEEDLTDCEASLLLDFEFVDMATKEGNVFYFIEEERDPASPLLLLRHGDQIFFIPEDLLPDREGEQ